MALIGTKSNCHSLNVENSIRAFMLMWSIALCELISVV